MDKKIRNLLILLAILALLLVGYAAVGLLLPEGEGEGGGEGEADTEVSVGSLPLFRVTEDGLTSLSYTYDKDGDGESELWSYTRAEDGTWTWAGDARIPLSSAPFASYAATFASAVAEKTLHGVAEEELAAYGLDTPKVTVTFTDAVGGAQSFCIGAYNAYNGTYCVLVGEDRSTVYLVSGDLPGAFEESVEAFVSYDDLPAFKPEALVSLTLTHGDRTVRVTRNAPATVDAAATWQRSVGGEAPVTVAGDLAASLEMLVGDMDYLACLGVTEAALAEHGLAEDVTRMTLVYRKTAEGTVTEETFTLTLGGTDRYGYYYANPEETTLTMLLGGSVFRKLMTYDDASLSAGDGTAIP